MLSIRRLERWHSIRWFRKRRRRPADVLEMFDEISFPHTGVDYTAQERWQDFQRVFLGTAQGKRVLYEIIGWAGILDSAVVPGDPHMTYFREGMREIGVLILAVLRAGPPDKAAASEAASDTYFHEPEPED